MTTLTPRQEEVLWLIADGMSNKLIAARLDISEHTVKFHVADAAAKYDTRSRTKAAVQFVLERIDVAKQKLKKK